MDGPTVAPSTVLEDEDNEPFSAFDMELAKTAPVGEATVADVLPGTHEAERTAAEAETTLPLRGMDGAQDTKAGTQVRTQQQPQFLPKLPKKAQPRDGRPRLS